jgi:hypothetical protein
MKLGVAAAAIVIAAVLAWWLWPRDNAPGATRATAGDTTGSAGSSLSSASTAPPRHVTRVSPGERQRIADRISAAQREHHASPPGPRPSLPPLPDADPEHDFEHVEASLKDAMTEAIPILADCYEKTGHTPGGRAGVMMKLTGDPSVGTLIDADQLTDEAGAPLDPPLDNCLRDTFLSLELPPLHEGDSLHVQYTFKFDDDDNK